MSLSKPKVPDVRVTTTVGQMDAFLRPLWSVAEEGILEFNGRSLTATVKDPANVGLADVRLEDGFDEFEGKVGKVGVPFGTVSDLIETCGPAETLRIRPSSKATRQRWEFGDFELNLAVIDTSSIRDANVPSSVEYTAAVTLPAPQLRRAIERAGMLDEYIRFEVDPDGPELAVSAEADTKDGETRFTPNDVVSFPEKGSAFGLYSYGYLKDILAPTLTDVDEVTVSLGRPTPIEVAYRREGVAVRGMVTPLITEDPR